MLIDSFHLLQSFHDLFSSFDINNFFTFGAFQVERLFKDEATEEKGERARMVSPILFSTI